MNRFLVPLFLLLPLAAASAADLGADVVLMPPPGWKSVEPYSPLLPPSPFATLKYMPADGRRAAIIITLMPADVLGFAVKDFASLDKFTLVAAQPYLPADASAPRLVEHKLPTGLAACVTATYPTKQGIAAAPESFRMVTTASLLLDPTHLVHFTILHHGDDAPEFQQAVQTIRSVHLRDVQATAMGNREILALAQAEAAVGR